MWGPVKFSEGGAPLYVTSQERKETSTAALSSFFPFTAKIFRHLKRSTSDLLGHLAKLGRMQRRFTVSQREGRTSFS